jgi:hypothetical protein
MKKDISELDSALKIETKINRDGLVFKNVREEPFKIYGIFYQDGQFRRLPKNVADSVSVGVSHLSTNTAGGRVRFVTDSPYVAVSAKMQNNVKFSHMPLAGVSGFDMYTYENGRHNVVKSFIPPFDFADSYEGVYDFSGEAHERFITINFPLYNDVYELYIGIKEGSVIKPAPEYKNPVPIVYYGSSITQGGCASRPGCSYQSILSRKYDIDYINLGFSGNGKGEREMVDYIAGLSMSAFVLDYDHNSPTVEHYQATHEPFYKAIRAAHPDIPIIFITRPKFKNILNEAELKRIEIAKQTYENAISAGDKNVYFIPGYETVGETEDAGFVDGCHPTDLGFYFMAKRISKEFDKIPSLA